jgi:hypothetical protein
VGASSRDRITVDLRGLKAALFERARRLGVSPSDFVRTTLADVLGAPECPVVIPPAVRSLTIAEGRVRLSLRMSRADAAAACAAAQAAGLALGAYVSGLITGVPALRSGHTKADHLAALIASNAEMSTFGRNLGHLVSLLRQGSIRAAQEYGGMLDGIAGKVNGHLALASAVVAELRPRPEATHSNAQTQARRSRG